MGTSSASSDQGNRDNIMFMIEPSEYAQGAIGRRVEVVDFPDGRLEVRYKGVSAS